MMKSSEKEKNNEIDVIGSIQKILAEWKLLLKFGLIFSVLGVIVALSTPKQYTTTVLLAPESVESSSLGKLSSMGSMLGINLQSAIGSDAIYPEIYPQVISSTDFILGLFDVPVVLLDSVKEKTYKTHLVQDVKNPFWRYPMIWIGNLFKNKSDSVKKEINPFRLSKKEMAIVEMIQQSVFADVDKKTSVISISVTDLDPQVSAMIADTVMNRLQQYIIMYRTKKARHDLEYMEVLYKQIYEEYHVLQKKYTEAEDSHRNLILKTVSAKIEDMENEMQLKYTALSETAQQLQLAKGRVQEQTPAFTVIQSATIPIKASSTPRFLIVILFGMLGGLVDAVWVLFLRENWEQYRNKKK